MKEFSKKYHALLFNDFSSLNLTRISDETEFYEKQIIDSIYPYELFDLFSNELKACGKHLDIGFGGGFPLLPLAKLCPEVDFVGFEARRKKAEAVYEIASSLGLENVKTYHSRVEEIFIDESVTISFKAVGKIKEFLKKIHTYKKVTIFFYKGPNMMDLEEVPNKVSNFNKILNEKYTLPSGQIRHLVVYQSSVVPRRTKKDLVNLSELI